MTVDKLVLFRTIFEQSPLSTQIFAPTGEVVLVNHAWQELWKTSFSDIKGYNILKDATLEKKGTLPLIKKAFSGEVVNLPIDELELRGKKGHGAPECYWLEPVLYPIFNSQRKLVFVVLQHRDVTEKNEAETIKHRLASIVENSGDAIVGKTLAGIITNWNQAAERLFGYSALEAIGKSITIIIPPEFIDEEKAIIKRLKKGLPTEHLETTRLRKDGSRVEISVTISPIKDHRGIIVGASKIARDITERKKTDQEKTDFLSLAAHELKTPLTSMKIFIELLKKEMASVEIERAKYFVKRIADQSERLTELTTDLLDISRIETGKLNFSYQPFRIDELVQETVESFKLLSPEHTFEVMCHSPLEIVGDRYRIYQVLVNLLTNAIKYSAGQTQIIITCKKQTKHVSVSVQDFGIGIQADHLELIFQRLYQITDSDERTYPGLGLGLFISKEIIERHEGDIKVISQKGKGSTFSFRLPLHPVKVSV